jgi:divalent metal cation (Fe/Co/Zn/Cd) transporter
VSRLERHHYAWLSIAAALATIALKTLAWSITGSVGLLSDALESFVNLAGAGFALWMILITRDPPDGTHPFGHGKAEYFSSGFEGFLILGAAAPSSGLPRTPHAAPRRSISRVGPGLVGGGHSINFVVARVLGKAGERFNSIALRADSRHLMTDVWTSVAGHRRGRPGGLDGLADAGPVDRDRRRPAYRPGGRGLLRESVDGLMDRSLDADSVARARAVLDAYQARGVPTGLAHPSRRLVVFPAGGRAGAG